MGELVHFGISTSGLTEENVLLLSLSVRRL